MKKYGMLALATIFMLSMSVMAQDPMTPPQGRMGEKRDFKQGERPAMITPEKRAEKMAKDLGLTDAQKAEIQALFVKQDAKRQQQMEKGKTMREEMKTKIQDERKANDEELAKILGPEKFQQLQAKRAEHQQKMKEMREKHENLSPVDDGISK